MIKCVAFDVDGTLIDTGEAIIGSLQRLLKEKQGREYLQEELYFAFGIPGAAALERLGVEDIEVSLSEWLRYMEDFKGSIRVYEGITSCLEQLRARNIKMGIVTSKSKEEFLDNFVPMGLDGYFDYVICADDTSEHKPHPAPLIKLLELSDNVPEEVVFVGDTIYDKKCAEGAGVRFGLALWGAQCPEGIEPDWAFKAPVEVLEIING